LHCVELQRVDCDFIVACLFVYQWSARHEKKRMTHFVQTSHEQNLFQLRQKYQNKCGINKDRQRRDIDDEHDGNVGLINKKWTLAKQPLEMQLNALRRELTRLETEHRTELRENDNKTQQAFQIWHDEIDPNRYDEYEREKNELDAVEEQRQAFVAAALQKEKYQQYSSLYSKWDHY